MGDFADKLASQLNTARVSRKGSKYRITVKSHRDVMKLREMTREARTAAEPREPSSWGRRRRRINLDEYDPHKPLRTAEEIWLESNPGDGDG